MPLPSKEVALFVSQDTESTPTCDIGTLPRQSAEVSPLEDTTLWMSHLVATLLYDFHMRIVLPHPTSPLPKGKKPIGIDKIAHRD